MLSRIQATSPTPAPRTRPSRQKKQDQGLHPQG